MDEIMPPEEVERRVEESKACFSNLDVNTFPKKKEDEQGFLDSWMKLLGFECRELVGVDSSVLRSIAVHVYESQMSQGEVRKDLVSQMIAKSELYNNFLREGASYTDYVVSFYGEGYWRDKMWIPIQAAADLYGIRIIELNTFRSHPLFEYVPHTKKIKKDIFLRSTLTHTDPMYYINEDKDGEDSSDG